MSFFDLSYEIREMIYDFAFGETLITNPGEKRNQEVWHQHCPISKCEDSSPQSVRHFTIIRGSLRQENVYKSCGCENKLSLVNMLSTCKSIHAELLDYSYRTTIFSVSAQSLPYLLHTRRRSVIRTLPQKSYLGQARNLQISGDLDEHIIQMLEKRAPFLINLSLVLRPKGGWFYLKCMSRDALYALLAIKPGTTIDIRLSEKDSTNTYFFARLCNVREATRLRFQYIFGAVIGALLNKILKDYTPTEIRSMMGNLAEVLSIAVNGIISKGIGSEGENKDAFYEELLEQEIRKGLQAAAREV